MVKARYQHRAGSKVSGGMMSDPYTVEHRRRPFHPAVISVTFFGRHRARRHEGMWVADRESAGLHADVLLALVLLLFEEELRLKRSP